MQLGVPGELKLALTMQLAAIKLVSYAGILIDSIPEANILSWVVKVKV